MTAALALLVRYDGQALKSQQIEGLTDALNSYANSRILCQVSSNVGIGVKYHHSTQATYIITPQQM